MKNLSAKEFAWYAVSGVIIAFGIIAMVFGIVGTHMNVANSANFVKQFEETIHISLRILGIIIMAAGVAIGVTALLINAKRADRDVEKRIRREQRLAAQASSNMEVKKAVEVIEEPKEAEQK